MKPVFEKAAEVLAERLDERQRALLGVAMDFACYRLLSASQSPDAAAGLMADAVAAFD